MVHENIVFFDAEFAELKPNGVDFLSLALIKLNGEELYLEIDFQEEVDDWVKENVIPHLNQEKISKEEASKKVKEFLGYSNPYVISYVNQFDWMGICKLFDANTAQEIIEKVPFNWIPIDFATILFQKGITPEYSLLDLAKEYDIDINIKEHYALDDAKILKQLYEKIVLEK